MKKLERVYNELLLLELKVQNRVADGVDVRLSIVVSFIYLVIMLSLPLYNLADLLLFTIFPILESARSSVSFGFIFKRSLFVLPLVLLVAIFNPILDRRVVMVVGDVSISAGWMTFASIVVRSMLAVQITLLLIVSIGFHQFCSALRALRVSSLFITQLLFVYRYIFVLIQEAISMGRARDSRMFGANGYGIKDWGVMVGQLMVRTFERSERISRAMIARGFSGNMPSMSEAFVWNGKSTVYLVVWVSVFVVLRFVKPLS